MWPTLFSTCIIQERKSVAYTLSPLYIYRNKQCGLYIVWVHMAPAHICDTETIHYMYVIKSDFTM